MTMSKRTPTVALSHDEVSCALRLSRPFAQYGKPDTRDSDETNFLSVLGEFALSKHLYGTTEPVVAHRMESLLGAVMTGKVRDGHRDVPDAAVDVKATLDRRGKGWKTLNLMVAPYQVRSGVAYVSAVPLAPGGRLEDCREVVLAGWTDACGLREDDPAHLGWSTCAHGLLFGMDTLDPEDWPVIL